MKTRAKQMATQAIVAALTASLAPVPSKSTILPTNAVEVQSDDRLAPTLTFTLESEEIFLPLSEATTYLQSLNAHKRRLLNEVIAEREARGEGALFSKPASMVKVVESNIAQCRRVKDAIRIALKTENLAAHFPDVAERENFKAELVRFGKAIATSESLASNILSAMAQSLPPKKTCQPEGMPSADEVKAMIIAEHKKLGLSAPVFSS
ncbi:iron-sulfur cluster assembly scaffold protein SufA [Symbiopectobacterium purcellii]|uniref:iron-sulfur cluster assembly scaffold protein SufA n=1 Tax=Symbiopectobacterium purcellii TaxID=2871826 RepID=UPI003F868991